MAFLASFLRTLTLAFAGLHFRDPAPLGRGPRAPRVDARLCATRSTERAARAALWGRAKANAYATLARLRDVFTADLAASRACWAAAPDLMPAVRCFVFKDLRPAPTDEEKRSLREARRQANVTAKLPQRQEHDLIRKRRDEGTWRKIARASQLSPDYEAATTEVWRHIRATPRGAPNGTDVKAWAHQLRNWGFEWLATFAARSNETLLEDKQAIAAAELAFHLFDPGLQLKVTTNLTKLSEALARPFNGDYAPVRLGVIPLRGRRQRLFAGWALLRMMDRGGAARDAAYGALKGHAGSVAESVLDPLTRLVSLHMITHLSQDDEAAKWMALVFPAEKLCSSLEGYLFSGHGECRKDEWLRNDEEQVWLLEAGYRAVWGLARDNAKEITEHCGRGLVAAITQPGRDFYRERERAVALTGDASALTAYDYEAATIRNAAFALRILARNDKARRHVARQLSLPEAATIGDIDEAIMVASGADAASGLESAFAFVGRTVPPFLRRDAQRAVARTRVAWHHPAHAAPAVYGSLTVELLAAGLLRASWLRPFLGNEATASLVKRANEQALFSAEAPAPKPAPKPAVTLVRCSEDKVAENCASCVSHHGMCAGDCMWGGYRSFEKANLGIWALANPEYSYEMYELEVKLRWKALDEDGKKVFGRDGVCEPDPVLVECGRGEVAESCEACGTRHDTCGGECHWVRPETPKPPNWFQRKAAELGEYNRKNAPGIYDRLYGKPDAKQECPAGEGADGACLTTDVCAPRPPPPKPEEDTWARAKQGLTLFGKAAVQFIRETWPALLVLAIIAFILISQRTVIQHVLHKMSETFFELYIIALTDACVRHALLMGVAIIAWMRVGAPWLPFIFAPVFYGTLLPLWFLLACWLLICVVVPVWAAHTMHRFGRACYDAIKRRRASRRAARDGRNALHEGRDGVEAVLAGALDAQGPPPGAIHLRIRCDGEVVYFKVGLQVSIGAVFEAFAERKQVGVDQLRFRVEGSDSDVSDTVPTVGQLGFANLVLIDCFVRADPTLVAAVLQAAAESGATADMVAATADVVSAIAEERRAEAEERRRMAAADPTRERRAIAAGRRAVAAAAAERRAAAGAEETKDDANAPEVEVDPTIAALLAHVGLERLANDFAREDINAENVDAADLAGLMAPDDARRIVEAARDYKSLEAYLARADLIHLAAPLLGRTVESLASVNVDELGLGDDDARRLRDAIRDRPPDLHDSLERVEAAVDQVAADLHAQGAAQWADLAADVAAEASDAIKGCASTLLFVISVALVAPLIAVCTALYILVLEIALDGIDQVLCAYLDNVHVWQHMLGNLCNAIFVLTLAGPLLQAERRMVARVQVMAALGPLIRCIDSLKHRLTRRAVERREVNDGDVCPICHEELTDAEMGPLAFCRWGCGRAVHDECAKLWLTKSDSCVLCGAAWS